MVLLRMITLIKTVTSMRTKEDSCFSSLLYEVALRSLVPYEANVQASLFM